MTGGRSDVGVNARTVSHGRRDERAHGRANARADGLASGLVARMSLQIHVHPNHSTWFGVFDRNFRQYLLWEDFKFWFVSVQCPITERAFVLELENVEPARAGENASIIRVKI